MRIAFLIISHKILEQTQLLADYLAEDGNEVFVHVDAKCPERIPENINPAIHYLSARIAVNWGGFSMIAATMRLLASAGASEEVFDNYVLLSGECAPVKSNRQIRAFFQKHQGQSFLDAQDLTLEGRWSEHKFRFENHYYFDNLLFLNLGYRKLLFRWINLLTNKLTLHREFPKEMKPFFGSQWWALSCKTAKLLLTFYNEKKELVRYFKKCWAPDELFVQTVVMNSDLSEDVCLGVFRFMDVVSSPSVLSGNELAKALSSDFLFARKVDVSSLENIIQVLNNEHEDYPINR